MAGYDPIEMRQGWREPWDPAKTPVIEFSAAPTHHGMHRVSMSFYGDISAGLAVLRDGVEPRPVWSNGAPDDTRQALKADFRADEEWGPAAVVDDVAKQIHHGLGLRVRVEPVPFGSLPRFDLKARRFKDHRGEA